MTARSYHQYCGISYALDIIGERWTPLVIRELMAGPRRFTDLLGGLPGISTNLLTERLKQLEQHGVIRRHTLPPPAASTVYALTPLGQALEPTLIELGKWGSQFAASAPSDDVLLRAGSYALTLKTFFRPELAQGLNANYALHLGDEVLHVQVADGAILVRQGEPPHADLAVYADTHTFLGLLMGQVDLDEALAAGRVRAEGDPGALRRLLAACGLQ
jgi:DNA-binding HxlR family transcriptional regulator/putative sterol carrier protein